MPAKKNNQDISSLREAHIGKAKGNSQDGSCVNCSYRCCQDGGEPGPSGSTVHHKSIETNLEYGQSKSREVKFAGGKLGEAKLLVGDFHGS